MKNRNMEHHPSCTGMKKEKMDWNEVEVRPHAKGLGCERECIIPERREPSQLYSYLSFCLGPGSLQVRNAREGPQIQVNRKVGRFVADVFLEYGKKCRLELLEGKIFAEANLS
jgi:hypothetical protein